MKKWEYRVVTSGPNPGRKEITDHLNRIGQTGWRLIQVFQADLLDPPSLEGFMDYLLEREIPEPSSPTPTLNLSELREKLRNKGFSESSITQLFDTLAEMGVAQTAPPDEQVKTKRRFGGCLTANIGGGDLFGPPRPTT